MKQEVKSTVQKAVDAMLKENKDKKQSFKYYTHHFHDNANSNMYSESELYGIIFMNISEAGNKNTDDSEE